MNVTEAKTEVILMSSRKIMVNDNTPTGNNVEALGVNIGDRIYRSSLPVGDTYPHIVQWADELDDQITLSSGRFMLNVRIYFEIKQSQSRDLLDRVSERVIYLLNKKHVTMNAQYDKNLKCRKIVKASNTFSSDAIKELYFRTVVFDMTCDNESINC